MTFILYKNSLCISKAPTLEEKKWWEKEYEETEYELDISIPIAVVENKVVVEDTEDIYSMPDKTVTTTL